MLIPVQDMNFTIKNTGDFREYSLDEFMNLKRNDYETCSYFYPIMYYCIWILFNNQGSSNGERNERTA